MSPVELEPKDSYERLSSHQTKLVDTVFDPAGKRVVLLRADAGLGKSTGLVALVGYLFKTNPGARALFLAPGVLREDFRRRLLQTGAPSVLVDRYRFREMLETQSEGEIWPRGTVVILSPDFAKQADIAESLAQASWDLVIADDAHELKEARAEAFRSITKSAKRVVLASRTFSNLDGDDPLQDEDTTVVEWRMDQFVDHDVSSFVSLPRLREVPFTFTPPEVSLRENVRRLCSVIEEDAGALVARQVADSLDSSPAALENALRGLLDATVKNEVAVDSTGGVDEEIPNSQLGTGLRSDRTAALVRKIGDVLEEIESINLDSKVETFREDLTFLKKGGAEKERVWVVTEYSSTLFYVSACIEGSEIESGILHSGMSVVERERSLTSFMQSHGILVATVAAMQGLDLSDVTDIVLYDIPRGEARIHMVLSRLNRMSRRSQLDMHVLTPTNDFEKTKPQPIQVLRDILRAQWGVR